MILVYAAQALPVSIWMLRNFVATVPKELEEAAAIDGASAPRTFWRILFPLVAPGLVATSTVATAGGRPLLIVVRDAHRYPVARAAVRELLANRPSAIVVEMGLPIWHPPTASYLATFGATRASSLAAAELLGLAPDLTREVSAHGPDRP